VGVRICAVGVGAASALFTQHFALPIGYPVLGRRRMKHTSTSQRSALGVLLAIGAIVPATSVLSGCGAGMGAGSQVGHASEVKFIEGSVEACALTKLVNTADEVALRAAGASSRAASEILKNRQGADGVAGTADDRFVRSLKDVLKLKWIGPATMNRLGDFAAVATACGTQSVQLLAINDYHGQLEPPTGSGGKIVTSVDSAVTPVDAGGAEYLATHLKELKAANPNSLVVSAGDVIGATPLLSAAFHDEPTIESANAFGLDVASVGNHEFDEGLWELLRMQRGGCHPDDGCQDGDGFEGAKFEYLAANVWEDASGEGILPEHTIRQFGNARIGFIGLTLEGTPEVTVGARGDGYALHFDDEVDTINRVVPVLRAQGVESIVVLIHEGGAATGLYNQCDGISGPIFDIVNKLDSAVDVVISGHTNAAHLCDLNGMLVTSAAHYGRLITDIDLEIDELTGEVLTAKADNVIVTRTVAKDAEQTAIIDKYKTLVAPIANRVVTAVGGDLLKTPNAAGESSMGDVIADAQLAATSTLGAQIAFINSGGIRADLIAATISGGEAAGEVTYAEAFAVQPFANSLVTLNVTGAQIEELLETQWYSGGKDRSAKPVFMNPSSGFTYTWDSTRAAGDRVDPSSIRLNGVVIDPAATYRVTVNSFLAGGGDGFGFFKGATERVSSMVDLDALEAYLVANSPLSVPVSDRVTKL
jgi:5'-nucleotidase